MELLEIEKKLKDGDIDEADYKKEIEFAQREYELEFDEEDTPQDRHGPWAVQADRQGTRAQEPQEIHLQRRADWQGGKEPGQDTRVPAAAPQVPVRQPQVRRRGPG